MAADRGKRPKLEPLSYLRGHVKGFNFRLPLSNVSHLTCQTHSQSPFINTPNGFLLPHISPLSPKGKINFEFISLFDIINKKYTELIEGVEIRPQFDVGGFLFNFRAQGFQFSSPPPAHKGNRFSLTLSFGYRSLHTSLRRPKNLTAAMQLQTFACVLAGLLLLSCTLQTAVAESNPGKMKSMAEVLQILQNLDKYYSQAARPSPITDMSEIQEAVHKIRLRELDRNYLQRTRPRFGKRTYPAFEERLLNGEEVPVGEPQPWERFIR